MNFTHPRLAKNLQTMAGIDMLKAAPIHTPAAVSTQK
jgi:hypothetical protein